MFVFIIKIKLKKFIVMINEEIIFLYVERKWVIFVDMIVSL